jgi:hypothetical protein
MAPLLVLWGLLEGRRVSSPRRDGGRPFLALLGAAARCGCSRAGRARWWPWWWLVFLRITDPLAVVVAGWWGWWLVVAGW